MTRDFERSKRENDGINDLSQFMPEQPSESVEIQETSLDEMRKILLEKETDFEDFKAIEDKDSRTKKAIRKLEREIKDLKDYIRRESEKELKPETEKVPVEENVQVADAKNEESKGNTKAKTLEDYVEEIVEVLGLGKEENMGENLGSLKTRLEKLNTEITALEKKIKSIKGLKVKEKKDKVKKEIIASKQEKVTVLNSLLKNPKVQDRERFQEALETTNREIENLTTKVIKKEKSKTGQKAPPKKEIDVVIEKKSKSQESQEKQRIIPNSEVVSNDIPKKDLEEMQRLAFEEYGETDLDKRIKSIKEEITKKTEERSEIQEWQKTHRGDLNFDESKVRFLGLSNQLGDLTKKLKDIQSIKDSLEIKPSQESVQKKDTKRTEQKAKTKPNENPPKLKQLKEQTYKLQENSGSFFGDGKVIQEILSSEYSSEKAIKICRDAINIPKEILDFKSIRDLESASLTSEQKKAVLKLNNILKRDYIDLKRFDELNRYKSLLKFFEDKIDFLDYVLEDKVIQKKVEIPKLDDAQNKPSEKASESKVVVNQEEAPINLQATEVTKVKEQPKKVEPVPEVDKSVVTGKNQLENTPPENHEQDESGEPEKKEGFLKKYWPGLAITAGGAVIALATVFGLSKKGGETENRVPRSDNQPAVAAADRNPGVSASAPAEDSEPVATPAPVEASAPVSVPKIEYDFDEIMKGFKEIEAKDKLEILDQEVSEQEQKKVLDICDKLEKSAEEKAELVRIFGKIRERIKDNNIAGDKIDKWIDFVREYKEKLSEELNKRISAEKLSESEEIFKDFAGIENDYTISLQANVIGSRVVEMNDGSFAIDLGDRMDKYGYRIEKSSLAEIEKIENRFIGLSKNVGGINISAKDFAVRNNLSDEIKNFVRKNCSKISQEDLPIQIKDKMQDREMREVREHQKRVNKVQLKIQAGVKLTNAESKFAEVNNLLNK